MVSFGVVASAYTQRLESYLEIGGIDVLHIGSHCIVVVDRVHVEVLSRSLEVLCSAKEGLGGVVVCCVAHYVEVGFF